MARRRWFYSRRGTEHGPFKGREIAAMVQDGEITGSDLLWAAGRRPRPAASYRKLFRRRPSVRTRNWIVGTACISTVSLLLALVLSPGGKAAAMAPEHLHGLFVLASVALTLIAVAAPGICAIALESTFVDIPFVTVRQPFQRAEPPAAARPEPKLPPRPVGADATIWATPQALSWGVAAAQAFAGSSSKRRPRLRPLAVDRRVLAGVAVGLAGLALAATVWMRGPFRYESVSGSVAYADGTKMPITEFQLMFHPLARPRDAATRPPIGTARVDGVTGEFSAAMTAGWSGIVTGRHKVTVHAADGSPLPQHLVGTAYADPSTTLLTVDTAVLPLSLKIEKP